MSNRLAQLQIDIPDEPIIVAEPKHKGDSSLTAVPDQSAEKQTEAQPEPEAEPSPEELKAQREAVAAPKPKPMPSFSPRFVKARVAFLHEDRFRPAGEHLINTSGVPGFKWLSWNALTTIGKPTEVHCITQSKEPYEFMCKAFFTCEQTEFATSLGLGFILPERERTTLETIISSEGVMPDYVRKFPRLHYMDSVGLFPAYVVARYFLGEEDVSMVFNLDNISPSGLQIYTEDARVTALSPNDTLRMTLMPRGDFLAAVNLNVTIKRVIHTVNPESENKRWYLGLSIAKISEEHRSNFTDWLRLIVTSMRR